MKRFRRVKPFLMRFSFVFAMQTLCHCSSFAQQIPNSEGKTSDPILQKAHVMVHGKQQSLADIAKSLATQIGRGIVIDGIPVQKHADIDMEGNAKEALDQVTDTYDFTWSLSKRGIILMHKRFHHPDEYPQVRYPRVNAGGLFLNDSRSR